MASFSSLISLDLYACITQTQYPACMHTALKVALFTVHSLVGCKSLDNFWNCFNKYW